MPKKQIIRTASSAILVVIVLSLIISSIVSIPRTNSYKSFTLFGILHPKTSQQFVHHFLTLAHNNNHQALIKLIDGKNIKPTQLATLNNYVNRFFLNTKPSTGNIVALERDLTNKDSKKNSATNIILEYKTGSKWLLVAIKYLTNDNINKVAGIHFRSMPKSLEEVNRVTFSNLTTSQTVISILTVSVPLIILLALILCINSDIPKRKWLWILFILFGIGSFKFNWTTQALAFQPISIQLLGASWFRANCYAPLILSFSLPIGAILFLIRRLFRLKPKHNQP